MADKSIFILGSFVVSCSAKVPRFPRAGESLAAEIVTIEPGGKGLNLAIASRRMGAQVDGLLAIGDDVASAFAAPALVRADLPTGMLIRLPGKTGSGVGFTDARGETCLAVDAGVNLALAPGHVRAVTGKIGAAAMVMAQFEIGDEPIREAFALARKAGVATLLNPSPYRPIAADILANTQILVVNETEAQALGSSLAIGRDNADPAWFTTRLGPALLALGPRIVVLTRGAAGAIAVTPDGVISQSALPVAAVDSLGAGDAFAATLGVSLSRGIDLSEAMLHAAAAGALATIRAGVFDALPTRDAMQELIAETA
jgi:ribokinase